MRNDNRETLTIQWSEWITEMYFLHFDDRIYDSMNEEHFHEQQSQPTQHDFQNFLLTLFDMISKFLFWQIFLQIFHKN